MFSIAMLLPACLPLPPSARSVRSVGRFCSIAGTYQCPHCPVQSMPVIPSEFGVGTGEGRVAVCLGLLDSIGRCELVCFRCGVVTQKELGTWILELRKRRREFTRSYGPSYSGYVAKSSWILGANHISGWKSLRDQSFLNLLAILAARMRVG